MIGANWLSAACGVSSAASWGAGDFLGGLATRRVDVYAVVIGSQIFGAVALMVMALAAGEVQPAIGHLAWAALAGLFGGVGLLALYRALASGRMGLGAPVSGVISAGIPVIVAARLEGFPGWLRVSGFALAAAGVWLVARSESGEWHPADLGLPVVAGCSFGAFIVIISRASGTTVWWPLVSARVASVCALLVFAAIARVPALPPRDRVGIVCLTGLADAAGNAFLLLAARTGRLDVAAVLSSLYPASTVILARVVLHERVTPSQAAGLLAVLSAIVIITLR